MIKRNKNGQFAKGSKPVAGFKKGENLRENHPNWKGGLPKCLVCGKEISRRRKHCQEHSFTTERIEKIKKGALKRRGKNHWGWKGEKAGYRRKHLWITEKLGKPDKCDECGRVGLKGHSVHWANISGNYKKIISDWRRLCSKCHGAFDASRR